MTRRIEAYTDRITRIGVLQTGKITAVLYGVIGVIISPFILLGGMFGEGGMVAAVMIAVMLIVIYPIFGFIGGITMAAIFNFSVSLIGGFEITLDHTDD
ncbi:MAG: hypothetical protein VCC01_09680 [Candidatus Hydrogenedentota bacterium]